MIDKSIEKKEPTLEEWVKMYDEACKLPKDEQEEYWRTPIGRSVAQMGYFAKVELGEIIEE